MKSINHQFITVIFFIAGGFLNAQEKQNDIVEKYNTYKFYNTVEVAYLKTDKKIYFNGGSINFSGTIFNQLIMPSSLSKICYLELIHEDGLFHEKYVFRLDSGLVNDRINVPLDIPTGNYQLVMHTHYMKNFDLTEVTDRVAIYIQNTAESTKEVVSEIRNDRKFRTSEQVSNDPQNAGYRIQLNEVDEKVYVEIQSSTNQAATGYLVSEGFRTLQFVAKLNLKKKYTSFGISKEQLRGGFQKLILLDENLDILTLHNYYLNPTQSAKNTITTTNQLLSAKIDNNLLSSVELSSDTLNQDPLNLFRRIYRQYYHVPRWKRIKHLSFAELTSTSQLKEYEGYSFQRWAEIMESAKSNTSIVYYPENNIQLKGQIQGNKESLQEAFLAVYFFKNELNITTPLDSTGRFSIDLLVWPLNTDSFHASIKDKYNSDISEEFEIDFDTYPLLSYERQVDVYPNELTDKMFDEIMEFNYILSTYSEVKEPESLFWKDKKFDQEVPLDDYRGLESFEDIIREAAMNVSVIRDNGKKAMNMYSSYKGTFERPQLIALNNTIIKDPAPLFELSIDSIKALYLVYNQETLKAFGDSFTKGLLFIETTEDFSVPASNINPRFRSITGYYHIEGNNTILESFSHTKLSLVSGKEELAKTLSGNKETGPFKLNMEILKKDGSYQYFSEEVIFR